MKNILSAYEIREALNLDEDYSLEELEDLALATTSFIYQKTGYKFENQASVEPLAKLLGKIYCKSIFYGKDGNNLEGQLDYSVGLTSLIQDLQNLVKYPLI